ncbi:MAG: hypothetical protein EBR01_08865 [Proteobacteria bacterium]|jgi:hypothetical protein|nr:hypothetical protein [Pseudomonadota bacterium]NBY20918.1 hypothetical protein [bacterium]
MNRYVLKPFESPPSPFAVHVDFSLIENELVVHFSITGNITSLNLPSPKENPTRVEGLYQHTCLEVFLKRGSRYLEWNFGFTGDWCIFLFDDYRTKSSLNIDLNSSLFSVTHISHCDTEANFGVRILLSKLGFLGSGDTQIGLSTILEHPENKISYWALTHAAHKPDFHQENSFILTL